MVADTIPELTIQDFRGRHNSDLGKSVGRLIQAKSFEDLSTICIIPNDGLIPAKVAENWVGQVTQMNQKFVRLMMTGMEKYFGFNAGIMQILVNPVLSSFKYVLTMEENIIPPLDGLLKLFEGIGKYDVVGGLVWTKGIEGKPMIYGNPNAFPQSFTHTTPFPEKIQECLGLGTGFTLFKLDIFKDERVARPWFRTDRMLRPGKSINENPDMYFFENIHKLGYKVACDTRVRVGHYDMENNITW